MAWSPDGSEIAFWVRAEADAPSEIWVHSLLTREQHVLFAARRVEGGESLGFSPDGAWLLYSSRDTGREEVYVRSYPSLAAPRRVSSGGGSHAYWAADGRTIYYVSPTDQVMAVSVGNDDNQRLGTPQVVLTGDGYTNLWGVSPDGRRF